MQNESISQSENDTAAAEVNPRLRTLEYLKSIGVEL